MIRDTSRFENTRPSFTHSFGPGTTTATTSVESAIALALAASGGGGGGIQDMEYDCESTASTTSSSSLDQDTYAADANQSSLGSLQLRLVHPEYVDCSSIPDDAAEEDVDEALDRARRGLDPTNANASGEGNAGKPSTCNKATFPTTLFDILADPELDDIISWLPHGRSWKILDSTKFNESVLSSRFNQSKYTSFVRQVNGWGFRRVTVGSEANTYYHELFLRGRPGLLRFMRRQPASAHNTALRIRRNLKQVDQGADPDFYTMAKSYPLPPNCPTDKASRVGKGNKSSRSRSRSNSKAKAKAGRGNGSGNSSNQRRQRTSKKRRSSATTGDDVTDEDSTTNPKSRSSNAKVGNGRKSRKNSGVSSPRDSYVEPTAETDVEEVDTSAIASTDTAMEGVVSYGQAPAANNTMSLAGFSWHQETDALTFLDDPEVQAHGRLLQYGEKAPEAAAEQEDGPVPGRSSAGTGSSSAWPIPTTSNPSTGAISRPAGPSSMAFTNLPGQPEPSLSRSHSRPYQQHSTSSAFPIESQNYASVESVHQPQQSYGQDQRVDHYQHRQQALDFHSSYSSYATAHSSASTLASEPAVSKSEAYCKPNSADPVVAKDYSGDNHPQNNNQRLTASEILPMLQCLFD